MITDLVQIKRLGEKKRPENSRFRQYLKSHTFVERQFRRAAEEVHDAIDCQSCAECCRVGEVDLQERDVEKLARYLGVSVKAFIEEYTGRDDDDRMILKRTQSGCIFLNGNE